MKEKEAPRKDRGEIWKPAKTGDYLVGVLEKIRQTKGKFGPQQVVDLRTPKGKASIFCDKVLEDVDYKVGTTYKFKFLGWGAARAEKRSDTNNYRAWKVVVLEK